MKRVMAVLLVSLTIGCLSSCGGGGSDAAPTDTQPAVPPTASSSAAAEPSPPAVTESTRMVGISGSYIKDIQLGVSKFGMDDDSAEGAPDGAPYRWTATKSWEFPDTSVLLDYSIIGDDDSQLISGSFGATWDAVESNEVFCAAAATYLGFIATMPYDTADSDAAKQWVDDNIGTVAGADPISTTIGEAEFTLSGTVTAEGMPNSFLLQIAAVG